MSPEQSALISSAQGGTIRSTHKATPRRANARGHGTEGEASMRVLRDYREHVENAVKS